VKYVDLVRRHLVLTAIVVLVLVALAFVSYSIYAYGRGDEVPGERGDVFER
jgi:multisubunit Na+/H+ antiporter MnhC subunit